MMSRIETDSLGQVEVPDEAYWGAQTQRSLINFAIGNEKMPLAVLHALALIKKAGLASDTVGEDRRQRRWALSVQGQVLLKKLKPRWEAAQAAFEKRLGRQEATALKKASYLAASRLSAS